MAMIFCSVMDNPMIHKAVKKERDPSVKRMIFDLACLLVEHSRLKWTFCMDSICLVKRCSN